MRELLSITVDDVHWEPIIVPIDCNGYATLPVDAEIRVRLNETLASSEYTIPALAQDSEATDFRRTAAGGAGGPGRDTRWQKGEVLAYVRAASGVAQFRIKFVR